MHSYVISKRPQLLQWVTSYVKRGALFCRDEGIVANRLGNKFKYLVTDAFHFPVEFTLTSDSTERCANHAANRDINGQ